MIKESIKKRFQKMIKYCDELIEKCKDKTIDDLYSDNNFAEASCFVLGLIGEQVPGIKINNNGNSVKDLKIIISNLNREILQQGIKPCCFFVETILT